MSDSKLSFLLAEPLVVEVPLRHVSCSWKLIPFPIVSFFALGSSCLLLRAALCTHVVGQQRLTVQEKATSMGTTIHVKGLPKKGYSQQTLKRLFREYGNISFASGFTNSGFVKFSTASEAQAAIEKTNATQYKGSTLITSLARKRKRERNPLAPASAQQKKKKLKTDVTVVDTISVKGLPLDVAKEKLVADIFQEYGTVVNISLSRPQPPAPYTFVKYSTVSEAQFFVENMNGTKYGDSVLIAEFGKDKAYDTVYLGGLPLDAEEQKLIIDVCQEYGTVVKTSMKDFLNRRYFYQRCKDQMWAYVKYSTASEAQAAVDKMNGTQYGNSVLMTELARQRPF